MSWRISVEIATDEWMDTGEVFTGTEAEAGMHLDELRERTGKCHAATLVAAVAANGP